VQVDASAPSAPALTLSENPASGVQHVAGSTLYYRPGGSGSFRVGATSGDTESGIASIDFPAIANTSGGGSVANPGPYRGDWSWDGTTAASGAQTVTAHNAAGLTSSATFDLSPDSTAPTGQSVSVAGGWTTSASVALTPTDGTDNGGGSGLDSG